MPSLNLGELTEAMHGRLVQGNPETVVSSYSIDTRDLEPGGLFFALKGEHTDGHHFLDAAARIQAKAAVIQTLPERSTDAPEALIQVDDVVYAMAEAAKLAREKLYEAEWVGLTGSAGKTTTKEFTAAILATSGRTHRTQGNLNNHLGVPLSVLAAPDDTERVVIEMGMSAPGEIAYLTDIIDPDVGLVTNVQPAHLEFFPDVEAIAAAKGELFACLREDAIGVVNWDDPRVRVQAYRHPGPQLRFGRHDSTDLKLVDLPHGFQASSTFTVQHEGTAYPVELTLGGAAAARNALAALAIGIALGIPLPDAIEALHSVQPGIGRGQRHALKKGVTLIDDAYNCSPGALQSVLESVSTNPVTGRKVFIFGDMLELGDAEKRFHVEAAKDFYDAGIDLLITVGHRARWAAEEAKRLGISTVESFKTSKEAMSSIVSFIQPNDFIIVKGSRGVRLDRIVQLLIEKGREQA